MKRSRILVVDDEPGIRQSLTGVLEDEGYSASAVRSGEECLEELAGGGYDLVLLDVWLPGMDGIETLARIQEIPVRRAAGSRDHFRARLHRSGRQGDQARGVRFSGEAAFD